MDPKKAQEAEEVYARVLKEIKPSRLEVETTITHVNQIMFRLKEIVPKDVELVVTGSIARGTNLKGDADVDIFMLFDRKVSKPKLERLGLEYAKRIVNRKKNERYEVKYAEHPYTRLHLNDIGLEVDIVPAYKIDSIEEMATSVDRTPLHTKFLNRSLTAKQKDEVRLLKYMLKNHGMYGAEVKIKGFAGYLCELLIYHFESLNNLLENAARFKLPLYIDPKSKSMKAGEEVFKRFNSEFVVIDPVDENRNVAAGVSTESLAKFVLLAKSFVKKPEIEQFYGTGFSSFEAHKKLVEFIKKSGLSSYLIVTGVPAKSEDILWPQLRKTSDIILDCIRRSGFDTYLDVVWICDNKGFILYLTPSEDLKVRLFSGPSAFSDSKTVNSFLTSHKNAIGVVLNKDRVNVLDFNRYKNIEELLRSIVKGKVVGKRKDIQLKNSKLFVNDVPKRYAEDAYAELRNRITI